MSIERRLAASVPINDTYLWITGGSYVSHVLHDMYEFNYLSSTEFINIEGTTKRGPTLPIELSWHAMINIKNDFTMIVGGWVKSIVYGTSDVISENVQTFYYDHQREVGLQYFCQSLMTAILDIWLIYNN